MKGCFYFVRHFFQVHWDDHSDVLQCGNYFKKRGGGTFCPKSTVQWLMQKTWVLTQPGKILFLPLKSCLLVDVFTSSCIIRRVWDFHLAGPHIMLTDRKEGKKNGKINWVSKVAWCLLSLSASGFWAGHVPWLHGGSCALSKRWDLIWIWQGRRGGDAADRCGSRYRGMKHTEWDPSNVERLWVHHDHTSLRSCRSAHLTFARARPLAATSFSYPSLHSSLFLSFQISVKGAAEKNKRGITREHLCQS